MNVLSSEKQQTIIHLLVEGNSIRSIERLTGAHRDTIMRLLVKTGDKCRDFLDAKMRGLRLQHLELDEVWTFSRMKEKNVPPELAGDQTIGDQYLFVAFDQTTKLVPSFAIGKRSADATNRFINDLASRIVTDYPQISTDGFQPYRAAIKNAFGEEAAHGILIKDYAQSPHDQPGRYGPPNMIGSYREQVRGLTDVPLASICTSHVERNNLSIRTFVKRFTRLSLAFSKKRDNLIAAVALHIAHYNFCRRHATLRMTPAMAAGVADHIWELDELLAALV